MWSLYFIVDPADGTLTKCRSNGAGTVRWEIPTTIEAIREFYPDYVEAIEQQLAALASETRSARSPALAPP